MDPLVTSALVSAGSSAGNGLFGQIFAGVNARRDYEYFKKKMSYQDQIQDENIANERAYNSPAAVSARMRAAGLAPQTANNANAGLSSASPGVSADGAGTGPIPQMDFSALASRIAQKQLTPVEESVKNNNDAQAAEHNEKARAQKLENDAKAKNLGLYEESVVEEMRRAGVLNDLTEQEISNLENLMLARDTELAQGWAKLGIDERNAISAAKQAAAALVNAKVNWNESELRKANMQQDIKLKGSQIELNKAYENEATQRQKNLLEEINNLIAQRKYTEEQARKIKNQIYLNWATFGVNTAATISQEARAWCTFGLSKGAAKMEYVKDDVEEMYNVTGDKTGEVRRTTREYQQKR